MSGFTYDALGMPLEVECDYEPGDAAHGADLTVETVRLAGFDITDIVSASLLDRLTVEAWKRIDANKRARRGLSH